MTTERIIGGIEGLLVGDALGVPYEFKPSNALPPLRDIEFEPPAGFSRSHASVPPGTWSDDGAQALCLIESLVRVRRFDVDDFARNMVRWYGEGVFAVDGIVFDIGIQTADALRAISRGVPALHAARRDVQANGNGALMRILPLALWHRGADDALVRDARLSSRRPAGRALLARSSRMIPLYTPKAGFNLGFDSRLRGDPQAPRKRRNPMALVRRREDHAAGMTRPAWNPFEAMYEMMRWDPFQNLGGLFPAGTESFSPNFDLKETDDAFVLQADMPGVKEKDLDVSLEGKQLTISGERSEERREQGEQRHMYERSYGSFTRTLGLPDSVDTDHIEAELKHGVLRVNMPKKREARPRRIRLFGRKSEKSET